MDDRIARQRQIVADHIRGENEKDWEAVYGTFVQDDRARYDVVPLGTAFRGIDGVRGFYQGIAAAIPDLHIEVISQYDFPGCTVLEVVITGTHQGDFLGVKALGNRVRLEMAAFYAFDSRSEKLVSERIYFDQVTLAQQMQGIVTAA